VNHGTRTAASLLALDAEREAARISAAIREQITQKLKRRGAVLGLSGGVDSSVAAALCVQALGAGRVIGLLMPDRDSAAESLHLGKAVGERLGIRTIVEDVTSILEGAGCYDRRDRAIRSMVPEYGPGYRSKIVLSAAADDPRYRLFFLVVESPDGQQVRKRLTAEAYLDIVAATNFKQRARKMVEYYHADRHRFAVVGTANRLEHDQGFFVKNGDGSADLKPLAHLYKTQVYRLAEFLRIPEEVRRRSPTADTYSLAQTQEEFYFLASHETLDLCLYGLTNGLPVSEVAMYAGLTREDVHRVYQEIVSKRRATIYQKSAAMVLSDAAALRESSR
jgi:NAD+ synthase